MLGSDAVKVWLTVNPADYSRGGGKVYVAVRTDDGYTAAYTRPGLVIAPAQMKVITQDIAAGEAPQPAVDLSGGGPPGQLLCGLVGRAGVFVRRHRRRQRIHLGRRLPQPSSVTKAARFRHRCRAHRTPAVAEQSPSDRSREPARRGRTYLFHADDASHAAGRQRRHRALCRRRVG